MARLDRLAPVKEVAQIGAAIGREFPHRLVEQVAMMDEAALPDALERLVGAELLFRRGSPPNATYTFKHALVQDTAYASLLRARRQAIHERIATVLVANDPERAESAPELVAHHYTEAGQFEKAIPYWNRAGHHAATRPADTEAREHLQKALSLLKDLPESSERDRQELEILIGLGPVVMNMKGSAAPEVGEIYSRARDLCDRLGQPDQLFPALWGLWLHNHMAGQSKIALSLAHEAIALAESLSNEDFVLQAHHAAWTSQQHLGDFVAVVSHADRGLELYDVERHQRHTFTYGGHDPGICAATQGAIASWFLGYPEQAEKRAEKGLELAPKVPHTFTTAHALATIAQLRLLRREPERALQILDDLILFSEEHTLTLWWANGQILQSWALSQMGRAAEVLGDLREGIRIRRAAGSRVRLSLHLAALAHALAQAGETGDAQAVIAEALAEVETTDERTWESVIHWMKGQILGAQSVADLDGAAACYERARSIAKRQSAKSMELRAAMSLAELREKDGLDDEARDLVAPIYAWFTEGFETPDLKEAKRLLDRLG